MADKKESEHEVHAAPKAKAEPEPVYPHDPNPAQVSQRPAPIATADGLAYPDGTPYV